MYPSGLTITPDPSPGWRSGRSGMRKPGNRSPNGLSCWSADVRTTLFDEIFTTAGKTLFTTGANVAGIVAPSRTAGAAAATAASGAWPIAAPPTKAPPTMDPMLSMITATIHIGYLVIRFMILVPLDNLVFERIEIRRTSAQFVSAPGQSVASSTRKMHLLRTTYGRLHQSPLLENGWLLPNRVRHAIGW